ncbi:GNAT family N-acetyltransferase [Candidatus Pacearchaeota archaeon]|nr:GNAT family N-acetyltransferase [Candidatus Pacearchaeota archaeon]
MKITARFLRASPRNFGGTFAALDGNSIVDAMIGGQTEYTKVYLEFWWIFPEYRQTGLGRRMLETFEDGQKRYGVNIMEVEATEVLQSR